MRRRLRAAAVAMAVAGAVALARGQASGGPHAGSLSPPAATAVLVELFTAEGCSSCPPADRLLEAMIAAQPTPGAVIVGLGEHVDYWNALGWKDRFSSSVFTERQQTYADRLETGTIYTPQMVVDGTTVFVGSDVAAARAAIEKAAVAPHGRLRLDLDAPSEREIGLSAVVDGLPSSAAAEILIAVTEDGLRSDVKKGENAGKALTHAAVVRGLTSIGQVTGDGGQARTKIKVASEWKRDRLKVVGFVQEKASRRVLATAIAGEAAAR